MGAEENAKKQMDPLVRFFSDKEKGQVIDVLKRALEALETSAAISPSHGKLFRASQIELLTLMTQVDQLPNSSMFGGEVRNDDGLMLDWLLDQTELVTLSHGRNFRKIDFTFDQAGELDSGCDIADCRQALRVAMSRDKDGVAKLRALPRSGQAEVPTDIFVNESGRLQMHVPEQSDEDTQSEQAYFDRWPNEPLSEAAEISAVSKAVNSKIDVARNILFRNAVSVGGYSKRLASSEDCSDISAKLLSVSRELADLRTYLKADSSVSRDDVGALDARNKQLEMALERLLERFDQEFRPGSSGTVPHEVNIARSILAANKAC